MSASPRLSASIRPHTTSDRMSRVRQSWPCEMESAGTLHHSLSDNNLDPSPRLYARHTSISESRLQGLHLPTHTGHHQVPVIPDMPLILSNHSYPNAVREQRQPPVQRRKHSQITEEFSIEHEPIIINSADNVLLQASPNVLSRTCTDHDETVEDTVILFDMPEKIVVKTHKLSRRSSESHETLTNKLIQRGSSVIECVHKEVVFAFEAKIRKDQVILQPVEDITYVESLDTKTISTTHEETVIDFEAKICKVAASEELQQIKSGADYTDIDTCRNGTGTVCVESIIIFEINAKIFDAPSPSSSSNNVEGSVSSVDAKLHKVFNRDEQLHTSASANDKDNVSNHPSTVRVESVIIFDIKAKTLEAPISSQTDGDIQKHEEVATLAALPVSFAVPYPLKPATEDKLSNSQTEPDVVIVYDIEAKFVHLTAQKKHSFSDQLKAKSRRSGVANNKDKDLEDKKRKSRLSSDVEYGYYTPVQLTAFKHETDTSVPDTITCSNSHEQIIYNIEAKVCRLVSKRNSGKSERSDTGTKPYPKTEDASPVTLDNWETKDNQDVEVTTQRNIPIANPTPLSIQEDIVIHKNVVDDPFVYDTNPRSRKSTQQKKITSSQTSNNKLVLATGNYQDDFCDINSYSTRSSFYSEPKPQTTAPIVTPSGNQAQPRVNASVNASVNIISTQLVDVCPTSRGSISDVELSEEMTFDEDEEEQEHGYDNDSDDGFVVPYQEQANATYHACSAPLNSFDVYRIEHQDNIDGVVWQNFSVENVTYVKGPRGLEFCIDGGMGCLHGDRPITIKRLYKGASRQTRQVLHAGDEIVAVNSVTMNNVSRYAAWYHLKSLPLGPVNITLKRLYSSF